MDGMTDNWGGIIMALIGYARVSTLEQDTTLQAAGSPSRVAGRDQGHACLG